MYPHPHGDGDDEGNGDKTKNNDPKSIIHPLLIDHVAKKLFSFVGWTNREIFTLRLVCRTWSNLIINTLRRKALVRQLSFGYEDADRIQKFVNDMFETTNLPFDCYTFDHDFFIGRHERPFHDFFTICGSYITNLSLSFGKNYSLENFRQITDVNFYCLKTLSFRCVHHETRQDLYIDIYPWMPPLPNRQSEGLLCLLTTILQSARGIEHFDFHLPANHFSGDQAKFVNKKFGDLLAKMLPDSVITLKLMMELHDTHLVELARLNLQVLHLQIYGFDLSENVFRNFLNSQRTTLVDVLLIDFDNEYSLSNQISSEFPKVKFLEIKGIEDSGFSYVKYFPNAQTLVLLTDTGFQKSAQMRFSETERKIAFKSITHVELKFIIPNSNIVHTIMQHLPSVKKLKIQAAQESNGAIAAIFERIKGLLEFDVNFPRTFAKQPVDHLFTGLPLATCLMVQPNEIHDRECQSRLLYGIRRNPSLDNLISLEKLVIRAEESAIILTDVTMYCAVLRLPNLREIELVGDHAISAQCMASLRQRLHVKETGRRLQDSADANSMALVPVY